MHAVTKSITFFHLKKNATEVNQTPLLLCTAMLLIIKNFLFSFIEGYPGKSMLRNIKRFLYQEVERMTEIFKLPILRP
jgi:hypothetical protein